MRILVIRLSSMGDVVLASTLFSCLKKKEPAADIHFLTSDRYAELFADDTRLSSVTGIRSDADTGRLESLSALSWDKIVDLQNSAKSRRIRSRFFAGVAASTLNKLHVRRIILLLVRINLYNPARHVAARYLEAAGCRSAAGESLPEMRINFSKGGAEIQRSMFGNEAGRPVLALMPFCAWKNKQWPAGSFAAVGRHFTAHGWNVAIMGGPGDAADARALRADIGTHCVSSAGDLSLYDIGRFMATCDLALGNDTGLSHLARACGVRCGIIYGATTWHFGFFPFGTPAFAIFEAALKCRPCHAHGGDVCIKGGRRPCLNRVTPAQVIAGMKELRDRA